MNLGLPQIIYSSMLLLGIGISMAKHGNPKSGNESCIVTIIATIITVFLLWWGGFYG